MNVYHLKIKRLNILLIVVFIFLISILFIISNLFLSENKSHFNKNNKTFKILLWTKYWKKDWPLDEGYQSCRYSNCIFTRNRDDLTTSDVIVFHWNNIKAFDLPKTKQSNQKWILFNLETPVYTFTRYPRSLSNINLFKSIDWLMSYRKDSDIYQPYGRLEKCATNWTLKYKLNAKNKSIAWISSNCKSPSKRQILVEQLKHYLNVDVFGSCGHRKCARNDQSCYQLIEQSYKFYLSFENSLCKDYVTEKLFRTIQYDIIPIVYGSANYSSILPHNSYIDVFNFTSIEQLSDYLKQVMSDQRLYESYFEWKKEYCVRLHRSEYLCKICEHLNEKSNQLNDRTKFDNLVKWWAKDAKCFKRFKRASLQYNLVNK